MLHSVRIENVRVFRQAEIAFEPLTVVIGANASGKSSLLEILKLLGTVLMLDVEEDAKVEAMCRSLFAEAAFGETSSLHAELSRGTFAFPLHVTAIRDGGDIRATFGTVAKDEVHELRKIKLSAEGSTSTSTPYSVALGRGNRQIGKCILLRLEPSHLTEPWQQSKTLMTGLGEGLAAELGDIQLRDNDRFLAIQDLLKKVVPQVERVRFGVLGSNGGSGRPRSYELRFDMKSKKNVPAMNAGEGTLFALGMILALSDPVGPSLVLIDEIEKGIHPGALKRVVEVMRAIMTDRPDLQIVATSHSPYLVDALRPEEVRMTSIGADGAARIAPMVEIPEFEKWKDVMHPGELWSAFGERWITERAEGVNVQ